MISIAKTLLKWPRRFFHNRDCKKLNALMKSMKNGEPYKIQKELKKVPQRLRDKFPASFALQEVSLIESVLQAKNLDLNSLSTLASRTVSLNQQAEGVNWDRKASSLARCMIKFGIY